MSSIKRCDRCGEVFVDSLPSTLPIGSSERISAMVGIPHIDIGRINVDLCQSCWDDFRDFWKFDKVGNYIYDDKLKK